MYSSAKCVPLLLVVSLVFTLQTQARDPKFFSKVTRDSTTKPTFLPQTTENAAYGLYARPAQLDSESTTSKLQKEEPAFDNNNMDNLYNNMDNLESTPDLQTTSKNYAPELQGVGADEGTGDAYFHTNNNNNNNNNRLYNGEKQGMSDTRFLDNGRYFRDINNNHKPATYNNGRAPEYYNNQGYYTGSTHTYNTYYSNPAQDQTLDEDDQFHYHP